MKFRAFLLALAALSAIGGLTFVLFEDVKAQKAWRDFVNETAPLIVEAQEQVDTAQETADAATTSGVEEVQVQPLTEQILVCQGLIDDLSGIAEYIAQEDEQAAGVGEGRETQSHDQGSAMADLDLLAEIDFSARLQVDTPEHPYQLIRSYSGMWRALEDSLNDLDSAAALVETALGEHLEAASATLTTRQDTLRLEIARGRVLQDYAETQGASEQVQLDLADALDSAQELLIRQRGLDRTDASAVAKSIVETDNAIAAITTTAKAVVDELGIQQEELNYLVEPEQVWTTDDAWLNVDTSAETGTGVVDQGTTTPTDQTAPVSPGQGGGEGEDGQSSTGGGGGGTGTDGEEGSEDDGT